MARFYKYRSLDDLAGDALRLGLELPLSEDFGVLFEPVEFGSCRAGNRFAIQPMEGCDGTLEGHPDELTYRRYRRFGAGGAKIIWAEATAVTGDGRMNPRQLWLTDQSAPAIRDMLDGCRTAHREALGTDDGLVIGLQLTHSGRYSFRRPLPATHDPLLDPLTLDHSTGRPLDEDYPLLSDDELKGLEDRYVEAAQLAWEIGVDFVDIKQCHRYLLSELLAATNRPGPYGGSLENRTRLVRNIVGRIRDLVPGLTVATRLNVYDGIPYRTGPESTGVPVEHDLPLVCSFGTDPHDHLVEDLTEPLELVVELSRLGVALFNVSAGNPYANPHVVRPAEFAPVDGYEAPEHPLEGVARQFRLARTIQAALGDIPVIGSGYSWLQDYSMHAAAGNVAAGHVAIAGLGRTALAHPDFARTLQDTGRLERRQVCRTFSYCTNLMRSKDHPLGQYPTGCPPFDKEAYQALWAEAEQKLSDKSHREDTQGTEKPGK